MIQSLMNNTPTPQQNQTLLPGALMAIGAFSLWALFPIYWKQLGGVGAFEILNHRVLWSAVLMIGGMLIAGRSSSFRQALANPIGRRSILIGSLVLGTNWLFFLVAVNTGHVLHASLGYYINPLISIFLGMVVLKERLSPLQITALILAAIGVLVLTIGYGIFPWLSLVLSGSFGIYGLNKKLSPIDANTSFTLEMALLLPVMGGAVLIRLFAGDGSFLNGNPSQTWYLIGAGIVTTVPLLLFSYGAKRIPLSMVGFIQYITPTGMLLLGVLAYREEFSTAQVTSFLFIWIALAIYTISLFKRNSA
ncbi:MAG: EamA family transporter RarD [Spirochaetales bacterium]|nr:EamA family transporter RarD [Spirochaetales bacterium]MCF7939651.1 EamA family transporter RarD [Spirochaetales bacterium]